MEEEIGNNNYKELVKELLGLQYDIAEKSIPLSGHFIDYRGSMINWCPIGREATKEKREAFIELDKNLNLRDEKLKKLNEQLEWLQIDDMITVKLGGDTSFDIYPKGWNKTYALKHLEGYDVWFVGDRCEPTGNDYELYNYCGEQGYITTGPTNTIQIIDTICKKIQGKKQ